MDLNNLNIEDLKAKILTFTDEKTLIKSGIAFGAIIFFLIIYYSILIFLPFLSMSFFVALPPFILSNSL